MQFIAHETFVPTDFDFIETSDNKEFTVKTIKNVAAWLDGDLIKEAWIDGDSIGMAWLDGELCFVKEGFVPYNLFIPLYSDLLETADGNTFLVPE